jgi:hypothetical protein
VVGPVGDEVVPVVDEQAQLALGAVERGDRQVRLPEGGAGDREGVDRVALAGLAARGTDERHQPRRHPQHLLARREEVPLEAPREVPAVLEGPGSLRVLGRPAPELEVPLPGCGNGPGPELAPGAVDRDDRVRALVQIPAKDDHVRCLLRVRGDDGPVGGHT